MSSHSKLIPRSALYVPADNERALAKAASLPADAIIFDLEDAVSPNNKERARQQLSQRLKGDFSNKLLLRINALDSKEAQADHDLLWSLPPEQIAGVVIPKAQPTHIVSWLPNWLLELNLPIWAMIETPLGVLKAHEVAEHPRVAGLIAGTNDLAFALHTNTASHNNSTNQQPQRLPLLSALSSIVLAARAFGKVPLDSVYNNIDEAVGFAQECQQGKDLGFAGKTLIHPSQLAKANAIFGVSQDEQQEAKALLAAWENAKQNGDSVCKWQGRLIEAMHAERAREALARADLQNLSTQADSSPQMG